MTRAQDIDPFDVDSIRLRQLSARDIEAFKNSYVKGVYPELSDMSSTELWDELSGCSEAPDFRLRRLKKVSSLISNGASVLDIGVGWGEIIPMILSRGQRKYMGVDFSERIIARIKKKHPECKFLHGSIDSIDDKFDVVLALEVCEHIPSSRIMEFYRQIRRLLNHRGKLVISVPVYENLKASTLKCPQCGHMHNRMGHVRSYTPELICGELELAGFTVESSSFIYMNFDNTFPGIVKRKIVDLGRSMLGMGRARPLNIIVMATSGESSSRSTGP